MCYATPVQPKIGTDKIIQRYTHSTWFFHALRKWFQRFTPAQPEIFVKISLYTTLAQPDFYYISKIWFQDSTPAQPEIFAKISLYTTLAQPDFYYISKIWFQDSTPAQPEIFVDDMIVHYTRTTWLSLHLYNLISGFYTCTSWNLCLYGKVAYFALHLHTLIFITFAKHDFRGFFILVVCMFTYTYFVLIFKSTLSVCQDSSWNRLLFWIHLLIFL